MNKKGKLLACILFIMIVLMSFLFVRAYLIRKYEYNFILNGSDYVSIIVGEDYTDEGYTLTPERLKLDSLVVTTSNLDTTKPGIYEIKYRILYNKTEKEIKRTIEVKDVIAPTLKINEKVIHSLVNKKFDEPKYSATDDIDGDITDKVLIDSTVDITKAGTYYIKYSVIDSSGNKTTDEVKVIIEKKKDAYIEVSIKKQKIRYYEYGEEKISSDIVTGINDGTPRGTYSVINKAKNITLTGPGYASFVNYWIDFKDHVYGIHDASWRNKFGGNIYKTNGSHGCVNMPLEKVKELYKMVSIGTPVYIYD